MGCTWPSWACSVQGQESDLVILVGLFQFRILYDPISNVELQPGMRTMMRTEEIIACQGSSLASTIVHMQPWCLLPVRYGIRMEIALGTFTTTFSSWTGSALDHSNSLSPVSVLSSWCSPWADGLEAAENTVMALAVLVNSSCVLLYPKSLKGHDLLYDVFCKVCIFMND